MWMNKGESSFFRSSSSFQGRCGFTWIRRSNWHLKWALKIQLFFCFFLGHVLPSRVSHQILLGKTLMQHVCQSDTVCADMYLCITCQRWLQHLHCEHCSCGHAGRWPAKSHPSQRWSDGRTMQSGVHSSLLVLEVWWVRVLIDFFRWTFCWVTKTHFAIAPLHSSKMLSFHADTAV